MCKNCTALSKDRYSRMFKLILFMTIVFPFFSFAVDNQPTQMQPLTPNNQDQVMDTPWLVYKNDPIPFIWLEKDGTVYRLHAIAIYDISDGVKRYENGTRYTPKANTNFFGQFLCPPLTPDPNVPDNVPNQVYYRHWSTHPPLGYNWWYRIEEKFYDPGSLFQQYDGYTLTPARLGHQPGDVITFRALLLFDYFFDNEITAVYLEMDFRILVSGDPNPLPKINGWYSTDMHYHTWNTDNEAEFGYPTKFLAMAADRIGLDCVTMTDHSCDVDNIEWYYDEWPGNDVQINWNHMGWEQDQYTSALLIRGEEISGHKNGYNPWDPWAERHFLGYSLTNWIQGEYPLEHPSGNHEVWWVFDRIEEQGGFAYWAHPGGDQFDDETAEYVISRDGCVGFEIFNCRKTHTSDDQCHPWGTDNPHLGQWQNEKNDWDFDVLEGLSRYDGYLSEHLNDYGLQDIRKLFLGGGSDAHGGFNYNVSGSILSAYSMDGPFGCWRTAVACPGGLSRANMLSGLRNGRSVVTDGPMLIFGIDKNRDGDINDAVDIVIGDGDDDNDREYDPKVLVAADPSCKFYFQWYSNTNFGSVYKVELYMGSSTTANTPIKLIEFTPNNYSGTKLTYDVADIPYTDHRPLYLRAVGYSRTGYGVGQNYRCFTNPIWIVWEPRIPTNLQTEYVREDEVKIKWYWHAGVPVSDFTVLRSDYPQGPYNSVGTTGASQYWFINNLGASERGHTFYYKVKSHAGSEYFTSESLKVDVPWLDAPTVLRIANQPTPSSITVQWYDNSQYEAGFKIARKRDVAGRWDNDYATVTVNVTSYTDTVSLLHEYSYMVRAYDAGSHYSEWSNVLTFTCGSIAMSSYPKMTAHNNGARTIRWQNNIYVVDLETEQSGKKIYALLSTDGGTNFTKEEIAYSPYLTSPAICLGSSGTPYIVWGQYARVYGLRGPVEPGWHLCYYVRWYSNGSWSQPECLYDWIIDSDPNHNEPDTNSYLMPPSFTVSPDSGYLAFKSLDPSRLLTVARFSLSSPTTNTCQTISGTGGATMHPTIGFDNNSGTDRIVVLANSQEGGPLTIYYRNLGSTQWSSVTLNNYWPGGSPSLWVGTNEILFTFEGDYNSQFGLYYVRYVWNGTYVLDQAQLVTDQVDLDDYCFIGYTYLAAKDVVLWKYLDDIWYAVYAGGVWGPLTNLSNSADLSSYSNAITYYMSGLNRKMFLVWTEKFDGEYYLIKQTLSLAEPPPPDNGTQADDGNLGQKAFHLFEMGSNPIKGGATIRFYTPQAQRVVMRLYDLTGRCVKAIYDQIAPVGITAVPLKSDNLAQGIYFLKVTTDGYSSTKRMVMIK